MNPERVTCQICGAQLKTLNNTHFAHPTCKQAQKKLNIQVNLVKDYKKLYPGAPTICQELKDKNAESALKTWQTRSKEDIIKIRQKAWNTRKLADPSKKAYEKLWKTRRERYGKSGHKDPEKLKETGKIWWNNLSEDEKKEMCQIFKERAHAQWENWSPEQKQEHRQRTIEQWKNMSVEERKDYTKKQSAGLQKYWDTLPKEDKKERILKSITKAHSPNQTELQLEKWLTPYGFKINVTGPICIETYIPDFINEEKKLIIEYDGWLGHSPDSPFKHKNLETHDDKRDNTYRKAGYQTLRIHPEDMKKGEQHIRTLANQFIKRGER